MPVDRRKRFGTLLLVESRPFRSTDDRLEPPRAQGDHAAAALGSNSRARANDVLMEEVRRHAPSP